MPTHSFDDLAGKVCVLTGGAGVIGSTLVGHLAAAGVRTAVLDLNQESARDVARQTSEATGVETIGVGANVLERESLAEALEAVHARLGPVDLLINGAGGNSPRATTAVERITASERDELEKTFFGLDVGAFDKVFALNFTGTVLPTMVFGPDLLEQGGGVILNISSMNSFRPLTKIPAYSAAKASINNFTQWLAVHLAPQKIRVNAIAPGFFLTHQNRFLLVDEKTESLTARGQTIVDGTPMGRFGDPEDLVGTVLYLLSNQSAFVTGVVVPIDGGFNAFAGV